MTTDGDPPLRFGSSHDGDHPDRTDEWARLRSAHLRPADERPPSSAAGVHHQALISSDVERTIDFYQGLLEFPLTDLFQNRDYDGSTHFFFDIGNGNALAFFDFPGLGLEPYREVLGGHHHLAISMPADSWLRIKAKLDDAGIGYWEHQTSLYLSGPDGERIELLGEPLGQMYGNRVL
jgi:catechol 2,3-dioxygenase-like lactoylglutathione lyase family enzyme